MKPLVSTQQLGSEEDVETVLQHGVENVELDLTDRSLPDVKSVLQTLHRYNVSVPTLHYDLTDVEQETGIRDALQELDTAFTLTGATHASVTPPSLLDAAATSMLARFAESNNATISIETQHRYARIPVINALVEEIPALSVALQTREMVEQSAPVKKAVESLTAPIHKVRVADTFLGEGTAKVPGTGDIPLNDVFATVDAQKQTPFIVLDLPEFTSDALHTAMHHFENTLFSRVPNRFHLEEQQPQKPF